MKPLFQRELGWIGVVKKLPSAWISSLLKKQSSVIKGATASEASSAESKIPFKFLIQPPQTPSTSADVGSIQNKNYERFQGRKQRKKMLKG